MSQKDVAYAVGVGHSLVSHWIAGTHFARPAHLDGLATVLKCSYEDFVRDPEIPLQLAKMPEPSLKIDDLLEQLADRAGYKLVPKKRV